MPLDVDDCDFCVLRFQFDLVCNDEWKQPFSSTVYFIGVLVGSFVAGQISDRYSTHKEDHREDWECHCRHSHCTSELMNKHCCTCTTLNINWAEAVFKMITRFVTIVYLTLPSQVM